MGYIDNIISDDNKGKWERKKMESTIYSDGSSTVKLIKSDKNLYRF